MCFQISFLKERFATVLYRTDKVPSALMLVDVNIEALLPCVGLVTVRVRTLVGPFLLVNRHVVRQVALRHECLRTVWVLACVWFVQSLSKKVNFTLACDVRVSSSVKITAQPCQMSSDTSQSSTCICSHRSCHETSQSPAGLHLSPDPPNSSKISALSEHQG